MTRFEIVWTAEVLFGMYVVATGLGAALPMLLGSPLTGLIMLLVPLAGLVMLTKRPLTALAFAAKDDPAKVN